jgi:thioredoxin reductase (NADPH)
MKFIWNTVISEIRGTDTVNAAHLRNIVTGEENNFPTDGVFIFIGHSPNTQLFSGQLDMDEKGYLIRDELMQTNVPGVFAAGEVADPHFRQVVTSAGMGAAAAMGAVHFIQKHEQDIK